jgi:hypothetical protein
MRSFLLTFVPLPSHIQPSVRADPVVSESGESNLDDTDIGEGAEYLGEARSSCLRDRHRRFPHHPASGHTDIAIELYLGTVPAIGAGRKASIAVNALEEPFKEDRS